MKIRKRWTVQALGAQYGTTERFVVPGSEMHFMFRISAQWNANRMNGVTPIMVLIGDGTEQPLNIWEVRKRD